MKPGDIVVYRDELLRGWMGRIAAIGLDGQMVKVVTLQPGEANEKAGAVQWVYAKALEVDA